MHTYITRELPDLVSTYFHVDRQRKSITGFSMGGLGALTSFLKHPNEYMSVSAFAPISHPSIADPWGITAFTNFFGSIEGGKSYDPTLLMKEYQGPKKPMLID